MVLSALCLAVFCGKPVVKQQATLQAGHQIVRFERNDTVGYLISFHDSTDRKKFSSSFERLLSSYQFRRDTLEPRHYFRLDLPAASRPVEPLKPVPAETLAHAEAAPVPKQAEAAKPKFGGSVTIYSQRGFLDKTLSQLVECLAFGADACQGTLGFEPGGYLQAKPG